MEACGEYKDRFATAMGLAGMGDHEVARAIGVSYQAVKKVLLGSTKSLSAENNSIAARAMRVSSDWLATGEGTPRGVETWPFSPELLARLRAETNDVQRRAENAARVVLDMDPLPPRLT